jgi:small Trp-rich protein
VVFVFLALLYLLLKYLDVAWLSRYSTWWVLLPLALAAVWWNLADQYGYTQRKAMERMDQKREARRLRQLEAMGRGPKRK